MSIFDEPKIDCHLHIFDPHRFPYREDTPYRPTGQEIGTAIQFRAVMQAYGVPYALLVGPNSGYGFDNRCMLDAIAQGEGRFKGVGVVPNDVSAARLAELKAQGVLGVTVNVSLAGVDHFSQADTLFNRLADLDMFAQVQYEKDQLLGLLPLIGRTRARLLIDHSGRPDAAAGLNQPGFQALLRLADTGRAVVKLSGMSKFSALAHPFADARPYQQALLDTFGPEGCLWASDWPFLKAPERLDYGPLLRLAQDLMPDPQVRRQVMWETPRRLFGFGD
ncbi:MAG: amidohydrolase family protein [Castellaniella sp.]|uniref:amidohydrolase family protein n=1 Tax=Castellaniella sp. TaxID=1955812 RepID=UPI003C746606